MSETLEIMIGISMLLGVIILTRRYHAWRIKKAYMLIVEDLKSNNAYDPESAIELTYAQRNVLKMGLRDHRPMALDHLILDNIVGTTDEDRYFLKDKTV